MKIRNWIMGEDRTEENSVEFKKLDEKKRKEISVQLNVEAAKRAGYERTA